MFVRLVVLGSVIVAASGVLADRQARGSGAAVLAGVVVRSDGQPLNGATVTLETTPSVSGRSTATTIDGAFHFTDVPAGRYSIFAEKGGYVAMSYGATRYNQPGTSIVVSAGDRIESLRIVLPQGGAVAGTLLLHDGQPARLVSVAIVRPAISPENGERRFTGLALARGTGSVTSARTNSRGEFRLYGLPPGRYGVRAYAPDDAATRGAFAATYFPGTLDPEAAEPITVQPGQEHHITFALQRPVRSSITGTVTSPGGRLANLRLMISRGPFPDAASVSTDGTFSFLHVTPGTHLVQARAIERTAVRTQRLWGQSNVTVTDTAATRISITMAAGMPFSGRVTIPGSRREPPPSTVTITLAPMYPWQRDAPLTTQAGLDGRFVIDDVAPGRYLATVLATPAPPSDTRWSAKAIVVKGEDVTDSPINIEPDEVIADAVVELTDSTQEITGLLRRRGGGQASNDVIVLLFPSDRRYWTPLSRRIRFARPATDGQFGFADIPEGRYYLIALSDPDPDEFRDPAFLEPLVALAMPLILASGEHKALVLETVNQAGSTRASTTAKPSNVISATARGTSSPRRQRR